MTRAAAVPGATYRVHLYGFDPCDYAAASPGAARYRRYQAFREAGHGWSFHEFLVNSNVQKLAPDAGRLRLAARGREGSGP